MNYPPGKYECKQTNNAFKRSFDVKADQKTVKTILSKHHQTIVNSELNDFLTIT